MKNSLNAYAIGFCLSLANCTTAAPTQPEWTPKMMPGLHMELIHSVQSEQYSFYKGGAVAASVGSHDIVIGPAWRWRIRNGRLQIYSDSQVENELTLISRDQRIITARKPSGVIARYRYSYRSS